MGRESIFNQLDAIRMAMATKKIPQISETTTDIAPFDILPVALPASLMKKFAEDQH